MLRHFYKKTNSRPCRFLSPFFQAGIEQGDHGGGGQRVSGRGENLWVRIIDGPRADVCWWIMGMSTLLVQTMPSESFGHSSSLAQFPITFYQMQPWDSALSPPGPWTQESTTLSMEQPCPSIAGIVMCVLPTLFLPLSLLTIPWPRKRGYFPTQCPSFQDPNLIAEPQQPTEAFSLHTEKFWVLNSSDLDMCYVGAKEIEENLTFEPIDLLLGPPSHSKSWLSPALLLQPFQNKL